MRGLKHSTFLGVGKSRQVAPLVGAWIETAPEMQPVNPMSVAPLVGAWIETLDGFTDYLQPSVAPLVGAWIETTSEQPSYNDCMSHPSWVRGLKQYQQYWRAAR